MFAPRDLSASMIASDRASSSRRVCDGRIALATTAVGNTFMARPIAVITVCASLSTSRRELESTPSSYDWLAKRDKRPRPIADGIAHHFGELAAERPSAPA